MSKVKEFFTYPTNESEIDWNDMLSCQYCRYTHKKCFKTRKSNPEISIGTCTVTYGKDNRDVIICPHRLLERHQIFVDCLHLLNSHTPGNELHIVSEVSIPGGSVTMLWFPPIETVRLKILLELNFKQWTPQVLFGQRDFVYFRN